MGTQAIVLAACMLVFTAALVRFWLAGGAWSPATMTFRAGSTATVIAALTWVVVGDAGPGAGLALSDAGALLWISGGLDAAPSLTFQAKPARYGSLSSRSGILSVVVLLPTASLAWAFADSQRDFLQLTGAVWRSTPEREHTSSRSSSTACARARRGGARRSAPLARRLADAARVGGPGRSQERPSAA